MAQEIQTQSPPIPGNIIVEKLSMLHTTDFSKLLEKYWFDLYREIAENMGEFETQTPNHSARITQVFSQEKFPESQVREFFYSMRNALHNKACIYNLEVLSLASVGIFILISLQKLPHYSTYHAAQMIETRELFLLFGGITAVLVTFLALATAQHAHTYNKVIEKMLDEIQ